MTFVERTKPDWILNKCIGINKPLKPIKQKLLVTDAFGTPLEPGQTILYHQKNPSRAHEGKLVTVVGSGEIVIQYGFVNQRVSTLSDSEEIFDCVEENGTLRYMQIFVVK